MSSPSPVYGTGWGAGARVAGTIVALGYLLGLVRGPVVAVVGGLALVTLGRAVFTPRPGDLALGASLAVLAGALGVGALRWGALDLGDVRGAQAVLGPTVLVGPAPVAAACCFAAGAALVALAVWLVTARDADEELGNARIPAVLWGVDAAVGGLAVVSVFWGPSIPRGSLGGADAAIALAGWALVVTAAGAGAAGGAILLRRHAPVWRWGGLAGAAVVTAVAAAVVVGTVL